MKLEENRTNTETIEIENYRQEVLNSASLDLEWVSYKGQYRHSKTKIFAAAFCTNWGERIVLHISKYKSPNPEKSLIQDILFYFNQFPLTFGWYTTGVAVYDNNGDRKEGRDSDFFILHQRCMYYNLDSPFEVKGKYIDLKKESENNHIDLIKVFEKPVIKDSVFEGRYRTAGLDSVSSALLGISKYDNIDAGSVNVFSEKTVEEQKKYVKRDAELAMLLAQYKNCLVLRLMKVFSNYSELDYYKTCNTNVSRWYESRYSKMIDRNEISLDFVSGYKLEKQDIGGGHHTIPQRGFFVNTKVYELDVKGMYPTIVLNNNISFDTLNCRCCEYNPDAQINQVSIDMINQNLIENKINRTVSRYWTCKRRKGAFPVILQQVLSDREKYLQLLKEEKSRQTSNQIVVDEYQTHQIGAKLFANAGFGLFGNEYFKFSNYKVAECITGEGRRIHNMMEQMAQRQPFNFEIVFGFTDSVFVNVKENNQDKIKEFIDICKQELGVTVEMKNVFLNSIVFGKKNRFVGWSGNEDEDIVIKGLDGLADSNPFWVRKWFFKIIDEIIKRPNQRFEAIPNLLQEAVFELENVVCKSQGTIEKELKFTQRLKKYPSEYAKGVRTGVVGNILGKDKGEEVYWYETLAIDNNTNGNFSTIVPCPENLNINQYTQLLFNKLKDTLEITGLDSRGVWFKVNDRLLTIDSFN